MASNKQAVTRMRILHDRIRDLTDAVIPHDERVVLDDIRNGEELDMCIKFSLEVYYGGKTEAVWAAEHPREYERLQRIAGTVPAMKTSGT